MKQLTRIFTGTIAIFFFLVLISFPDFLFAADGETLFKANCASCHKPLVPYVGPALKGARDREPSKDWVYKWVPNTTSMVNTDPYAMKLKSEFGNVVMTSFDLKKEEIDAILNWADKYVETPVGPSQGVPGGGESDNSILIRLAYFNSGRYRFNPGTGKQQS